METWLFEQGFIIKGDSFYKIEKIRRELKEKILAKKEELSYQKCAILLNDILYFSKLGMPIYEYVKQKYGIDVELLKGKRNLPIEELEDYAFYIFTELSQRIEKNKEEFNEDLLDDYDLTCNVHFYPTSENVLLLVETKQSEYLEIIEDHLEVHQFYFDVSLEEPPYGVSHIDWANRAKEWLSILNRCGGAENWMPSSGGFSVEMTENGLFVPDSNEILKYMDSFKNIELDKVFDVMNEVGNGKNE
jgi:hypothetical protein